jgi:thiol-disulfide isomerase/thioredoxin
MKRFILPYVLFLLLPLSLIAADEAAPAAAAKDSAASKPADEAWKEFEKLKRSLEKKPTSREEAEVVFKEWYGKVKEAAEAFARKFPSDPRSWKARLIAIQSDEASRPFTGQPYLDDLAADKKKLDEIINAADAPTMTKGEAAYEEVLMIGPLIENGEDKEGAFYRAVADYLAKYPDHPLADDLRRIELNALRNAMAPRATELLQKIAAGPDKKWAEGAKATLARKEKDAEIKKKPVELKFTAADGQLVDLSNLREKVVLLDFWASWCGPCMAEMPNVVSTCQKLHEKGFEVLGISLDREKGAMESALKKQNMIWPQYFEAGGRNRIAAEFGIDAIPATLLIDKKGMLRKTELRGEALGKAVEKLLEE